MYQKQPRFFALKNLPSYEGSSLHALHGFFDFLKNENHQAQFAYMKTMSEKNGIHFSAMDLTYFEDKTSGYKQKIEINSRK